MIFYMPFVTRKRGFISKDFTRVEEHIFADATLYKIGFRYCVTLTAEY